MSHVHQVLFHSHYITMTSLLSPGLWGTTLTENNTNNREQFVRTTMRELLVYLLFLVDICLRKCLIELVYFLHLFKFLLSLVNETYEKTFFFFPARGCKDILLH